jgi:DNA gyrase inhibitor GyrI
MMSRKKLMLLIPVSAVLVLTAFWLVKNSRLFTETPSYTVEKQDGAFEIRAYPDLQVAVTPTTGVDDRNGPFRRLFKFITGENAAQSSLAMTTPVMMESSPAGRTMGFIVPAAVAARGAPAPIGGAVSLVQRKATRMAVYRFDGAGSTSDEKSALDKIEAWIKEEKLTTSGEPVFAYYDPPWTPGFLRRSEIMIPLPHTP